MQPHSVSLCRLNVFCAVKNINEQDTKLLLNRNRLKHLILLKVTLKTRDHERYITINIVYMKGNYCTHMCYLSVLL